MYRRADLPAGAALRGPAVIEELDSTTLVLPAQELQVLADGILRLSGATVRAAAAAQGVDGVTMSVIGDQLVQIAQEMGTHMMRAAYSPIFSESRDFSCALFDREGRMIAQGRFNPAHLGAIGETVRCVLEELSAAPFEPGDVVIHNDPFRGGCHMPEHMLLRPVFYEGELVAFGATIGHMAEIGAVTVGSFASTATEVYQEGLRLPPVKLVRAGEPVEDIWKIILSNHRTPRQSWGDLHAMIGSLELADRRLHALLDRHGARAARSVWGALLEHGERLMRRRIEAIPDGEYVFEDVMEGDGLTRAPVTMRVRLVVRGDRAIVDYTGSDPQARGACQRHLRCDAVGDLQRLPAGQRHRDTAERRHVRMREDDRASGSGRERPLSGALGRRQHRDAAEARRHAARRPRRRHTREDHGRGRRYVVQLPLRRHRPADERAVRPLPLRGERLGRAIGRRRRERSEPHSRQLPQHARRGLRDALPVQNALLRARPGLGRAGPTPGRARRTARSSRCWRRR